MDFENFIILWKLLISLLLTFSNKEIDKLSNRYSNDITSVKGSKNDFSTSTLGIHRIMNETTPLVKTLSSRVYLIFSSQPNLVIYFSTCKLSSSNNLC